MRFFTHRNPEKSTLTKDDRYLYKSNTAPELYIGLMSGTSLDGIDAALVEFKGQKTRLIDFHYQPFSHDLRQQIQHLSQPELPVLLRDYGSIDTQLGLLFAETSLELLKKTNISPTAIMAIGSHGQTVYHAPNGKLGFSLQIGDPNRIAQITGITTIGDFRRRDIAIGGQGAPLVPAFHQAVFADAENTTTVLNIGGIANISVLENDQILGFDTGPGNTLMDFWCLLNQGQSYDYNGNWASQGHIIPALLQHLLDDDYFRLPPPKSTGKEYFSAEWLQEKIAVYPNTKPEDIQATLCRLTATSIADAIMQQAASSQKILVCGGGVHNKQLLAELTAQLPIPLISTSDYGIDPDHVEAMAFAWLARQTLNNLPGNLCRVTGASAPAILGGIYPGHNGLKGKNPNC